MQLASFLDVLSALNCAFACLRVGGGLLAMTPMNNEEESGDARLVYSEILQYFAAIGGITFSGSCGMLSQYSIANS